GARRPKQPARGAARGGAVRCTALRVGADGGAGRRVVAAGLHHARTCHPARRWQCVSLRTDGGRLMGPFNAFWLATTLQLASPLIFAGSGELIAERAGVLNIGLEGMMLVGAFAAYWATVVTGNPWLGVVAGLLAGLLLAALMALLSVQLRADQIVVGVGLNILALGVTNFAFRQFLGGTQTLIPRFDPVSLPVISSIPVVGDAVFRQSPLVYLAFLAALGAWFTLYRA